MNQPTKFRLIITLIWLGAFLLNLAMIEWYIHTTIDGMRVLLSEDRMSCMKPLITTYSLYLVGVLGFWYKKPIPAPKKPIHRSIAFGLAVLCTFIFNGIILFYVGEVFLFRTEVIIQDQVSTAATMAKWMSFLVAPANAYYFGMRRPTN